MTCKRDFNVAEVVGGHWSKDPNQILLKGLIKFWAISDCTSCQLLNFSTTCLGFSAVSKLVAYFQTIHYKNWMKLLLLGDRKPFSHLNYTWYRHHISSFKNRSACWLRLLCDVSGRKTQNKSFKKEFFLTIWSRTSCCWEGLWRERETPITSHRTVSSSNPKSGRRWLPRREPAAPQHGGSSKHMPLSPWQQNLKANHKY